MWLPTYARFVVALGGVLRPPRVRHAIDRGTGALLIGLGIHVAVEQR
jgi:threonine/homoserine/homoserine lactone efflux protein